MSISRERETRGSIEKKGRDASSRTRTIMFSFIALHYVKRKVNASQRVPFIRTQAATTR